jgi:hypothetical protein
MFVPLERALGAGGAIRVRPDDLGKPHNGYLKSRLCVVSELKETTRGSITAHDLNACLKEIIDPTGQYVPVNEKYERLKWVYVVTGMVLFTNSQNMLPVDDRERRLGFYRIEAKAKPAAFYADYLVPWLEQAEDPFDGGPTGWQLWVRWLWQRWQGLSAARRAGFTGHAPDTPEKRTMVANAASPVKELLGRIVAGDIANSDKLVPDISDLDAVRAGLRQAIETDRHGVDAGTRIPANGQLGDWLREMGAERLNYDPATHVHTQIRVGGDRQRLWAIRNVEDYRDLSPAEVAAVWEARRKAST